MAKTTRKTILIGASISGALLLVILSLGFFILRPQIASWLETPTPTLSCGYPSLRVGESDFDIQSLAPVTDTIFSIPIDVAHTAFWLQGTTVQYVFGLSAMPVNGILMELFETGESITVTWADCSKQEYVITSVDQNVPLDTAFFDQSIRGIRIFIPGDSNTASFVVQGMLPKSQVTASP